VFSGITVMFAVGAIFSPRIGGRSTHRRALPHGAGSVVYALFARGARLSQAW